MSRHPVSDQHFALLESLEALDAGMRKARLLEIAEADPLLANQLELALRHVRPSPTQANASKPAFSDLLRQLPLRVWLREILTYGLMLGLALWTSLTVPGLLAVFLVESVVLAVFAQSLRTHFGLGAVLTGLGKAVFGFSILGTLALASWAVARDLRFDEPQLMSELTEAFSGRHFLLGAGWSVICLTVGFLFAQRTPDLRRRWLSNQDGYEIALIAMLVMIFLMPLVGPVILDLTQDAARSESWLVMLTIGCRFVVAIMAQALFIWQPKTAAEGGDG